MPMFSNALQTAITMFREQNLFESLAEIRDIEGYKRNGLPLIGKVLESIMNNVQLQWVYATFFSHRYGELLGFRLFPDSAFDSPWHKTVSQYPLSGKRALIFDLVNRDSIQKRAVVWVRGSSYNLEKNTDDQSQIVLPEDLLLEKLHTAIKTQEQLASSLQELEKIAERLANSDEGEGFIKSSLHAFTRYSDRIYVMITRLSH